MDSFPESQTIHASYSFFVFKSPMIRAAKILKKLIRMPFLYHMLMIINMIAKSC
jgi:hypothetical protein